MELTKHADRLGRGLIYGLLGLGLCAEGGADPVPGLFNTGVDDNGDVLVGGSEDPHWDLSVSADTAHPGPQTFVLYDDVYPIPPWLANGPDSKWIAPKPSQSPGNAAGDYRYRIRFDLGGLEPSTAVITGRWTSDNQGTDVLLNGVSTGVTSDGNFGGLGNPFTISSGFVDGTNSLEFVVNNGGSGNNPTGVRIELSGTAEPESPPGTPPSIAKEPVDTDVGLGGAFSLVVSARGSRPLFYQWRLNGVPVSGATNPILTIAEAGASDAGGYDVVVTNTFGAVTSVVAQVAVEIRTGPCTRRTGVVISEVMYHPRARPDGLNGEFVELHNSNPWPEDLSGWRISGELDHTFAPGTRLDAYAYLAVAPAPADVEAIYGMTGVVGGASNKLSNGSGRLRLRKQSGAIVLDLRYSDEPPWPVAADGTGHSLVLSDSSYGEADSRAWSASRVKGGSPGAGDAPADGPLEQIVINEVLTHTDLPLVDAIELYNHGSAAVDISGCFLSDAADTNRFVVPDGTVLGGGGFVSFDENQLGFALSAAGETVYLVNPDDTRVIEALKLGGQANGIAFGRTPDGAPVFSELSSRSLGTNNPPALVRDVVINELMYNPISGDSNDEYVELHNRGAQPVDLGGWHLTDGISYTFPEGTGIPVGGFLVVAKNAVHLAGRYPGLGPTNLVGDYDGKLDNGGERIALAMPDSIVVSNEVGVTTNYFHIIVDDVTYADGGQWGRWADGGGSSLELIDARADNRLGPNWADSDESGKSSWVTVEKTDVMNLNHPAISSIDQLHVFLLDAGEALVDDVAFDYSGTNRVGNSGFESGTDGWFFQGTHRPSALETAEGFSGTQSLHLVATARGGVANRVGTQLSTAVPENSTATLRARVRWLRGHPEIVFRAVGSSIEAVGTLPVPTALGTPGAANSRSTTNVGPAITDVSHHPVLPADGEEIRVTARVQDVDGLAGVVLRYRIDPGTTILSVPMTDDGTGADAVAGDGLFGGTIPGQDAGDLVAFHVEASDGDSPSLTRAFPRDAPVRECLVRVGEAPPGGDFGTYRLWMTQATFDFWAGRENASNEDVDTTFVYGTERVIYNVGAHYGASDNYTRVMDNPMGRPVGYNLAFPSDEPLLGANGIRLDWPVRDPTIQREHLMYWILEQLELPNNYRRYIHFFINGVRRKGSNGNLYEDTQRPNGDMLREWYPDDSDGALHKTDPWFEANAAAAYIRSPLVKPLLKSYEDSTGNKKLAHYRFNWKPRSVDRTANDYSQVFALIDAANTPEPGYEAALGAVVDMDNWMRTFAMNDLASFWDSFGNPNSKNAYLYKPERSGWKIMSWDFDVGLGVFNDPPTAALFASNVDPVIIRMYNTPSFIRHYWRAMDQALGSFFNPAGVNSFLADRYDVFQRNDIGAVSPFGPSGPYNLSIPDWIEQRAAFIQPQLNAVDAPFDVTSPVDGWSTNAQTIVISGTAPVRAAVLAVNGIPLSPEWTTVCEWRAPFVLEPGTNTLVVRALGSDGSELASETLIVVSSSAVEWPAVVINEWMASNQGTLSDPADGEFDDWLELFNPTASPVDLSGWFLSDDPVAPYKYAVPAGFSVPSNGFLLAWADKETVQNDPSTRPDLHLPFGLNSDGESILLSAPDGSLIDRVDFGPQSTDRTMGRVAGQIVALAEPSPLGANGRAAAGVALAMELEGPSLRVNVVAEPGFIYTLDASDDLFTWEQLETVIATDQTVEFSISTDQPRLFLRVRRTP